MNTDDAIRLIQKRWPGICSTAGDEPVFVLAAGWRSGSTMLQRMLLRQCLVWGEPFGSSGLLGRLAQPLQRFAPNWPKEEFFLDSTHWDGQLGAQWTANLYPSIQDLLNAHVAFLQNLFEKPSRQRGYSRWGLKEVRYGIEYAVYLRWLFPKARFLFLIRNPYECWASYRRSQARVLRFWPEESITTAEQFGSHWVNLASGMCGRHKEVNGLLLRYDALVAPACDVKPIEEYLGFPLDLVAQKIVIGAAPSREVPAEDMERLHATVGTLAGQLGYAKP